MNLMEDIDIKSGLYVIDYIQKDGITIPIKRKNPNISDEEFLSRDPFLEAIEEASKIENFNKAVCTQKNG